MSLLDQSPRLPSGHKLPSPPKEYIFQPANPFWVGATILFSILLNIALHRAVWVPDFVAVTLMFWVLRQPAWVGMAAAFACGILIDVQQGSLLGQHAFAYVILCYLTDKSRKRLSWFSPRAQSLQVFPLLLASQLAVLAVRFATTRAWPGWEWFLASVIAAVLWPVCSWILLAPQRKSKGDPGAL